MPPRPLHASTVALLRDASGGLEVYLVEKARNLEFAGGAYVFPGGTLDDDDRDPGWADLLPPESLEKIGGEISDLKPEEGLAFHLAAVRELFEEAGILLAANPPGLEETLALRESLLSGKSFFDAARKARFALKPENLTYYSHWVTPEIYPLRFSARFFLAVLPEGQEPSPDRHEVLQGIWISPRDAMDKSSAGSLPLMTPTHYTLQELSHFNTAGDAVAWGKKRTKIPMRPWVDERGEIHLS